MKDISIFAATAAVIFWNLSTFFNFRHESIIFASIFLVLILLLRIWPLVPFALIYLFMPAYFYIVPEWLTQIPSLWFLFPFALCNLIIFAIPKTRGSFIRFQFGKIDRFSWIFIILTGILSTVALVIWAKWADYLGFGLNMMRTLGQMPGWLIYGIAIPLFALINALAEELVFRGTILQSLSEVIRNPWLVNMLHASLFASVHYAAGFPNGVVGYLMVFVYGIALGYLRQRTRGIVAPYFAHVIADLTIGYYLASVAFA